MLRELLARLAAGGFETPASLADGLGTSAGAVEEMLDRLGELGYLCDMTGELAACSEPGPRCSGCAGCAGCPSGVCSGSLAGGRVWALTDKGLEATRKG